MKIKSFLVVENNSKSLQRFFTITHPEKTQNAALNTFLLTFLLKTALKWVLDVVQPHCIYSKLLSQSGMFENYKILCIKTFSNKKTQGN